MTYKPPQESIDLLNQIIPYAKIDDKGVIIGVKDNSSDEIKKAFDLWFKKYALPAREAAKKGDLFY